MTTRRARSDLSAQPQVNEPVPGTVRTTSLRRAGALLALLTGVLTGCTVTPRTLPSAAPLPPSESSTPSTTPSTTTPTRTRILHKDQPEPGDCIVAVSSTTDLLMSCDTPHLGEVVAVETLPGGPDAPYPDRNALEPPAMARCKEQVVEYLGDPDFLATRLDWELYWPSPEHWAEGDRWAVCAVAELARDWSHVSNRRGSLRSALSSAKGFDHFQACQNRLPSSDNYQLVPCTEPHVFELIPPVKKLGDPWDPMPSEEQMGYTGMDHCALAVARYLGAVRNDVEISWVVITPEQWAAGFTELVCGLMTEEPVTGSLIALGNGPLPR